MKAVVVEARQQIGFPRTCRIFDSVLAPLRSPLRFESNLVPDALSVSAAPESLPDTETSFPAWQEPTSIQELTDMYQVENKYAGRTAGTTLFLVVAESRSGDVRDVVDGQRFKLFMAPAQECTRN